VQRRWFTSGANKRCLVKFLNRLVMIFEEVRVMLDATKELKEVTSRINKTQVKI
jgi:hypothetical protein